MINGLIKLMISKDLLVLIFKHLLCCVLHCLFLFPLWKEVSWITLGCRITVFWPTERMPIHPKQRVLLLHAEPDVAVGDLVHYFLAAVAVIVFYGGKMKHKSSAHFNTYQKKKIKEKKRKTPWTLPAGKRLYLRTSQRTSLFGSRLNGSLNMLTGMRYMSLLEPSAWNVLEPSKFHSGTSEGDNVWDLRKQGFKKDTND